MIYKIIREIESALKNEEFLAALALALTLPDICGKAEYPNEKNVGIRYKTWFDDNVGKYEKPPLSKDGKKTEFDDMPYMSGEIIYSLRCCFLHQGTPNIEEEKIHEPRCKVTHFTLIIANAMNGGSSSVSQNSFIDSGERTLEINIVNLCCKLCLVAKAYYKENKDKFDFFEYDLQDRRNGNTDLLWGINLSDI